MDSEFPAITTNTAEIDWIAILLSELGILVMTSYVIWSDNLGATQLVANPMHHSKLKHTVLDFRFFHERVDEQRLIVHRISNSLQMDYILTKALQLKHYN